MKGYIVRARTSTSTVKGYTPPRAHKRQIYHSPERQLSALSVVDGQTTDKRSGLSLIDLHLLGSQLHEGVPRHKVHHGSSLVALVGGALTAPANEGQLPPPTNHLGQHKLPDPHGSTQYVLQYPSSFRFPNPPAPPACS
jgi:hypothetical protein